MPKKPGPDHPLRHYRGRFNPLRRPSVLTFAEVKAIRAAHGTGRFSIASLARIYDISHGTASSSLKDTYNPRSDNHGR